jgi:Protein of unknown function (DUF3592)
MSTSTIDPELDQPLPRQVRAREGCAYGCGIWFFRLFMLPHTLIGPWLLFKAVWQIVLSVGVLLAGQDVDGKIVRKVETQGKKGPYYSAEYTYVVDQVQYQGRVSLDANEYAAMREGQAITVKVYKPGVDFGHWPGVASYSPLREIGGIAFVALFWNSIMSIFVYMLYVRPWRLRQLVRWGRTTEGIVRGIQRWTNKGNKYVKIRYEYVVPPEEHSPGGVFSGTTTGSASFGESIKVGSVVTVIYSPRRPKRNLLYALADFKAVAPRPSSQALNAAPDVPGAGA